MLEYLLMYTSMMLGSLVSRVRRISICTTWEDYIVPCDIYGYGGCCDVWPITQLFFLCSWTVALCWPLFLDVSYAKVHWGYTWICPTGITHLCQADPATRIHCFRKVNHLVTNQNYKSDTIFLCQVWLPEGGYWRVKIRSHHIKSQVWSLKPSAIEIWYCPIALWPPW
jgi:hypothetical protein